MRCTHRLGLIASFMVTTVGDEHDCCGSIDGRYIGKIGGDNRGIIARF